MNTFDLLQSSERASDREAAAMKLDQLGRRRSPPSTAEANVGLENHGCCNDTCPDFAEGAEKECFRCAADGVPCKNGNRECSEDHPCPSCMGEQCDAAEALLEDR